MSYVRDRHEAQLVAELEAAPRHSKFDGIDDDELPGVRDWWAD